MPLDAVGAAAGRGGPRWGGGPAAAAAPACPSSAAAALPPQATAARAASVFLRPRRGQAFRKNLSATRARTKWRKTSEAPSTTLLFHPILLASKRPSISGTGRGLCRVGFYLSAKFSSKQFGSKNGWSLARRYMLGVVVSSFCNITFRRATFTSSTSRTISYLLLRKQQQASAPFNALREKGKTFTGLPSSSRTGRKLMSASVLRRSKSCGPPASASFKRQPPRCNCPKRSLIISSKRSPKIFRTNI